MARKPKAVSLGETTEKPASPARKPRAVKPSASANKESENTKRSPRAFKAPEEDMADDFLEQETHEPIETVATHLPFMKKGRSWGMWFLASVGTLVSIGIGLWFTQLIEDLFARSDWLGWGASALLAIAAFSLLIIILSEIAALWRLRRLKRIREDVSRALEAEHDKGPSVLKKIVRLYQDRQDMDWHLSRLIAHDTDVMDDRDRLILAERYLMQPLDTEAKQVIVKAARRIAIVTAVNPAPSLDVLFTGFQILRMLRELTALYGNRPGSIGTLRLAGMVGSHLAVTGGLALSDSLLQQFLGKGIVGRLSAKMGEGTVNGIMTARIGIAALDVCRPMPFVETERPGLTEFVAAIAGATGSSTAQTGQTPEKTG